MPGSIKSSRASFLCLLLMTVLLLACSSARVPSPAESEAGSPEAGSEAGPDAPKQAPVESWELLEVDEFNSRIEEAAGAGETWPQVPIDVVDHFIWGTIGGGHQYTWLEIQGNRVEGSDSTVVTLIRDRYADDSIRGDWHRIFLYKLPDGTWRLREARMAYRCYRGHQQESYGKRRCL